MYMHLSLCTRRKAIQGVEPGQVFSWIRRVKIAYAAGRGIDFLHEKKGKREMCTMVMYVLKLLSRCSLHHQLRATTRSKQKLDFSGSLVVIFNEDKNMGFTYEYTANRSLDKHLLGMYCSTFYQHFFLSCMFVIYRSILVGAFGAADASRVNSGIYIVGHRCITFSRLITDFSLLICKSHAQIYGKSNRYMKFLTLFWFSNVIIMEKNLMYKNYNFILLQTNI